MKKRLVFWLIVLTACVLAAGYFLPAEFAVERRLVIKAPPAAIAEYIVTPERWTEWSAWSPQKDSTIQLKYSGPKTGKGAKMTWTSESSIDGSLTILSASPKTGIVYSLQFDQDESPARGTILMQRPPRNQEGVLVVWSLLGSTEGNFLMRFLALNFDEWIGQDFEYGLDKLKDLAEASAPAFIEAQEREAAEKAALEAATSSTSTTAVATSSTSSTSTTAPSQ